MLVTLAAAWATTETPAPELVTLFTGYLPPPATLPPAAAASTASARD